MRLTDLITPELLKRAMESKSNPEQYGELKQVFSPVIAELSRQLQMSDPRAVYATALTMLVMIDDALQLIPPEEESRLRRKTDLPSNVCACKREECNHAEGCRRRAKYVQNGDFYICGDCATAALESLVRFAGGPIG